MYPCPSQDKSHYWVSRPTQQNNGLGCPSSFAIGHLNAFVRQNTRRKSFLRNLSTITRNESRVNHLGDRNPIDSRHRVVPLGSYIGRGPVRRASRKCESALVYLFVPEDAGSRGWRCQKPADSTQIGYREGIGTSQVILRRRNEN